MEKRFNRHHRLPRSRKGNSKPANISRVDIQDHNAYHRLFGNMLPDEVAKILSDTWIDTNYIMVAVPRDKLARIQRILQEV